MEGESAEEIFHAVIEATDNASKKLEEIRKRIHGLSGAHEELEHKGGHAFSVLGGHINLLHTKFGELRAGIGEVSGSLGEFLPMIGALGAAGSLAGLFELTAKSAEAQAQLTHTAAAIGVTSQALQRMDYAAKMTDTSQEAMQKGMERLNRAIGDGKSNKQAAALFAHLGIATRDARGHLKSAADILPQLANAFAHTQSAAMRTRMAMVLMGRGGVEMIPMLMEGQQKLEELQAEAGTIGHVNTPEQAEALEAYADSMKKAQAAVAGFGDTIGAALAPVLRPIVDGFSDWVVANREWIATDIAGSVKSLGDWLAKLNIKRIVDDVTDAAHWVSDLTDRFGGLQTVLGGVALVLGAEVSAKLWEATEGFRRLGMMLIGPVVEAFVEGATAMKVFGSIAEGMQYAWLANPFGVVIAGAIAVGAVAYELWNHWAWVKQKFSEFYAWFSHQNGWVQAGIAIVAPFLLLPAEIIAHWQGIKHFFIDLWDGVIAAFRAAWNFMQPIIEKIDTAWHFVQGGPAIDGGGADASSQLGPVTLHAANSLPSFAMPGSLRVTADHPYRLADLASPFDAPSTQTAGVPGLPGQPGGEARSRVDVVVTLNGADASTKISARATNQASVQIRRAGQAWAPAPG